MAKSNARVPLVERETVPAADLPAYDHVAKSRGAGRMPNVFKALANNPAVMDRVAAVGEYMRFQSKLDPQLRELAILTTAQEIRCAYEWTAHYTIAQKLGVPAKLLSSVGTPQIESEPAPLGPELRFARLVARRKRRRCDLRHGEESSRQCGRSRSYRARWLLRFARADAQYAPGSSGRRRRDNPIREIANLCIISAM